MYAFFCVLRDELIFLVQNVVTWTNLGFLYLYHNDPELANETFYRAQVLDPDYHLAWVGQGLVATRNGHQADSRALLEHAVSLTAEVVSITPSALFFGPY